VHRPWRAKFLGIAEICRSGLIQDWSASMRRWPKAECAATNFDRIASDDADLTDQVTRLGRGKHTSGRLIAAHAATILNELVALSFPERPPSAHAAQLAEWVGVLPEAA
jgi:hypothetical protein